MTIIFNSKGASGFLSRRKEKWGRKIFSFTKKLFCGDRDAQTRSSFPSSSSQNLASARRFHSLSKTVRPQTLSLMGLEGSLHNRFASKLLSVCVCTDLFFECLSKSVWLFLSIRNFFIFFQRLRGVGIFFYIFYRQKNFFLSSTHGSFAREKFVFPL